MKTPLGLRIVLALALQIACAASGAAQTNQVDIDMRLPITVYTADNRLVGIAEQFNATNAALRLDVVMVSASQPQLLLAGLERGEVDIMDLNFFYDPVVDAGYALNLDPWIQRDPTLRPWQHYLDTVRDERGQFVIPLSRDPLLVYAHADLFRLAGLALPTAGWTWDDFVQLTVALTDAANDQYGLVSIHPLAWQIPFVQSGQQLYTGDYRDLTHGLQLLHDLIQVHQSHVPLVRNSTLWTNRDFMDQRGAMAIASTSLARARNVQPGASGRHTDWITLPLPVADAMSRPAAVGNLQLFVGIAATSRHPFEAWSVISWLTSAAGAEAMIRSAGIVPVFAHPDSVTVATQVYGAVANEFFREPFLVMQDFRGFRRPLAAQFYVAMANAAERFMTATTTLDEAIAVMEEARAEFIAGQ